MPYVRVRDGQSLYVRVIGRGRPVLMLHGLGMNSTHWLPFIAPYLHRYRFYLPDFRGFGRSTGVRLNQADVFQNHAEDVDDIARALALHEVRLVAYSLGGSTALHWQGMGGFARVKRYLHMDQSPCVGNREDWRHGLFGERQAEAFAPLRGLLDLLESYPQAQTVGGLPFAARRQALGILGNTFGEMTGKPRLAQIMQAAAHLPQLLPMLLPLKRLDDVRAYLSAYVGGGHNYLPSLQDCQTPVTVVVGMQSPLYHPAGQMAIAEAVRTGRVVRFHRSGHGLVLDEPFKFVRVLGRFLQGH